MDDKGRSEVKFMIAALQSGSFYNHFSNYLPTRYMNVTALLFFSLRQVALERYLTTTLMSRMSEGYSPSVTVLQNSIGTSVIERIGVVKKLAGGGFERFLESYRTYADGWARDPGGSEGGGAWGRHRDPDGGPGGGSWRCHREAFEKISGDDRMEGGVQLALRGQPGHRAGAPQLPRAQRHRQGKPIPLRDS